MKVTNKVIIVILLILLLVVLVTFIFGYTRSLIEEMSSYVLSSDITLYKSIEELTTAFERTFDISDLRRS